MKEYLNVLDELNKGACMGVDSINYVLPYINDKKLLKVLRIELDGYNSIINNISKIYSKLSDKEPHETSTIAKIMTWYGIKIRVSSSNNTSKIAELFIQGNNIGIIEGTRLLNNKKMVISTNLSLNDLYNRYDERILSRLIGNFTICKFIIIHCFSSKIINY